MSWLNWIKSLWRPSTTATAGPSAAAAGPEPLGDPAAGAHRIRVGVVTTVGNYREHNEDNFYVPGAGTIDEFPEGLATTLNARFAEPLRPGGENGRARGPHQPPTLDLRGPFLVADGMGGQLAGEQASKIAVEAIPKELASRLVDEADDRRTSEAIRQAIAAANREIIAQSHVVPECTNMGTTVVLALFRLGRVYVAGIGDSRAYRLRRGSLDRLTRDHDLASALITAGTIRPDEAEKHQFRHVLYLYLGSPEARDGPEDVRVVDVRPGDRFLLASDGLTGVVPDELITELLGKGSDPQAIASELVDRALANDSKDNVTCLVVFAE